MDKVNMLQEILQANPKDAFARYGLDMELASQEQTAASLQEFATLLKDHPEYTPGYFMAAQTLARSGQTFEAKRHLQLGIASARRAGNTHAENEMQAMLDELELGI